MDKGFHAKRIVRALQELDVRYVPQGPRRQPPASWQKAQPKRLRTRMFRVPARFTWRSGYWRVHLAEAELTHGLLPRALRSLADSGLRGPPARAP